MFRKATLLLLFLAALAVPVQAFADTAARELGYEWITTDTGLALDGSFRELQSWYGLCDPSEPNYVGPGETNPVLASDDEYIRVDLPFTFVFYGEPQQSVYITTNGVISFAEPVKSDWYVNEAFPTDNLPKAIAPFWDDVLPYDSTYSEGSGEVRYMTYGTAPNRLFIVEWYDVANYNEQGDRYNIEVVLLESTNEILFLYRDMTGVLADGSSATIGLNTFLDNPYVQYSFEESVIPTGAGTSFGIFFAPKDDSWRSFGDEDDPTSWRNETVNAPPGSCAVTDEVDGWVFAGYVNNEGSSQTVVIRAWDGSQWTELPELSSIINAGTGANLTFDGLQLLNAGAGNLYAFVFSSNSATSVTGKPSVTFSSVVFVGFWDKSRSEWSPVGNGALSTGITGNLLVNEACAALTPDDRPALAFSGAESSGLPTRIYYAEFNPVSGAWEGLGDSLLTGITPAAGGSFSYDQYIAPALAFDENGNPWISYCRSVFDPETYESNNYLELRGYEPMSQTWNLAPYQGRSFSIPVANVAYSDLFVKNANGASLWLITWFERSYDTGAGTEFYSFKVMTTDAAGFVGGAWTDLGSPSDLPAAATFSGPPMPQVAFDFFDRPLLAVPLVVGEHNVMMVLRHDAEGWSPLRCMPEFGGVGGLETSDFDFALDRCGNPIVFTAGIDPASDSPAFSLLHYVIYFIVKQVEGEEPFSHIVHEPGVDSSTLWMKPAFSEPGLSASFSCGSVFLGGISGTFSGDDVLSLSVSSTGLSRGRYSDFIAFDVPFAYFAGTQTIDIKLLKMGTGVVLVVPDDYPSLAAAANAALPGDTVLLRPGVFPAPSDDGDAQDGFEFDGITVRGSGVDETIVEGDFSIYGPLWFKLESLTVSVPSTQANFAALLDFGGISGLETVPGRVWIKNVLFLMPGGSFGIIGPGQVWFKNCTFGTYPAADVKLDLNGAALPIFDVKEAAVSLSHCIMPFSRISSYPVQMTMEYCAAGSSEYTGVIDISNSRDGMIFGFVDPAAGDYHLMSTTGHWDPVNRTFVADSSSSPLIDAGNPLFGPLDEQVPNGYTVNLGAYGGTDEASLSPYALQSASMTIPDGEYRMVAFPFYPVYPHPDPWSQFVYPFLSPPTADKTDFSPAYDPTKVRLFVVDPSSASTYAEYPNVPEWQPGMGCWLIGHSGSGSTTVHFSGMLPPTAELYMPLRAGWNMVGLPYSVSWQPGLLSVILSDGTKTPLFQQTGTPLVATDIYAYDPQTKNYVALQPDSEIPAFAAVWIYAFQDVELAFGAAEKKVKADMEVSPIPAPVPPPAPPASSFTSSFSGGGGGCFVATAAFGSLSSDAVRALTSARDRSIAGSLTTASLVELYYAVSPEPAAVMRRSEPLRALFRRFLSLE